MALLVSTCPTNLRRPLSLRLSDTAPTVIYTLSLHDALPISDAGLECSVERLAVAAGADVPAQIELGRQRVAVAGERRSEEHTSELQSHSDLVCRLLLEKKKPGA